MALINNGLGSYEPGAFGPVPWYYVGFKAPIDTRMVTQNVAKRNQIVNVYTGLEVYCVDENKKFRYVGDDTTNDPAGWVDIDAGAQGLNFKGTWNATTNTPDINSVSGKTNGDYYKVAVSGTSDVGSLTGVTFGVNDLIIYNGVTADWEHIPYAPTGELPDIYFSDIVDGVKGVIDNSIPWWVAANHKTGQVVAVEVSGDTGSTATTVNIYKAIADTNTGIAVGDPSFWKLIGSTDYTMLAGAPQIDNTAGLLGSSATDNGAGVLLDAKEIDYRIQNFGGGSGGNIDGGFADPSLYAIGSRD